MYRVSVRKHFDAAHYLRNYKGKCENLHGHRFEVVVALETQELDEIGLAFDFSELKKCLQEILERFDHVCMNDIPPFDEINPTSENMATTIYRELQPRFEGKPVSIASVEVWESPESCATYTP
ncbi:MAG: 6-carboxytetrahydropterin synthase QueD [Chloroflexi bacterium]|jgi:6-pyruvoyltetrahydropterin/6-carboxytetrahydropterin synthase|nr:6-carboxytetrahydropterin synthase QueD [Chloroflexota bacterium]